MSNSLLHPNDDVESDLRISIMKVNNSKAHSAVLYYVSHENHVMVTGQWSDHPIRQSDKWGNIGVRRSPDHPWKALNEANRDMQRTRSEC